MYAKMWKYWLFSSYMSLQSLLKLGKTEFHYEITSCFEKLSCMMWCFCICVYCIFKSVGYHMATFIPKRKTVRYVRFCFCFLFFWKRRYRKKKINLRMCSMFGQCFKHKALRHTHTHTHTLWSLKTNF